MEPAVVLNVVRAAGVVLLVAASLLVLHVLRLTEAAGEAPPRPAPAARPGAAEDDIPRAA